ncbi:unnamed protein product, partial [Gulo gulo]
RFLPQICSFPGPLGIGIFTFRVWGHYQFLCRFLFVCFYLFVCFVKGICKTT